MYFLYIGSATFEHVGVLNSISSKKKKSAKMFIFWGSSIAKVKFLLILGVPVVAQRK